MRIVEQDQGRVLFPSGRWVKIASLQTHWRCNVCGGGVVQRAVRNGKSTRLVIQCSQCGGDDFISGDRYSKQETDAWEIFHKLPSRLRQLYNPEPARSAEQAIKELFD